MHVYGSFGTITDLHDTEQDIQTSERITNVQKLEEKRLLFKEVFWVKIQNSTKFILLRFVIISQHFN